MWISCFLAGIAVAGGCSRATVVSETADRNRITSVEIRNSDVGSAYDVTAKLRAHYLRSRGPSSILLKQQAYATVFLDDVEYGPISVLRTIPASTIAEIRFLEGAEATTKYGSTHIAGIIHVLSLPR